MAGYGLRYFGVGVFIPVMIATMTYENGTLALNFSDEIGLFSSYGQFYDSANVGDFAAVDILVNILEIFF
jgi:hypothetical protein